MAKELGIRVALIYRWRTEFLDKGEGRFPGHGKPKHTPQEAEIAPLKKQLRHIETECVYNNRFENQKVAAEAIFEFIESWYNRERLPSSLGYRTPAQMERLLLHHLVAA